MNPVPSSTWFSAPPEWRWLIVTYFFIGGLAGGSYFLAALIDLFGRREDRPLAHIGYYIAFPSIVLSGLLLTLDLTRPLRFWHMLIESNTFRPIFKYWSPMSIGSWALLLFGIFTFISFLAALAEDGLIPWQGFRKLRPPTGIGVVVAAIGGIAGFYVASYTGVLLVVSNRPIWADTHLLGMLFVVSAASTSAALIMLLAHRRGLSVPALADLHRMDDWMIALELVVLIALIVSLGPVARAWISVWGVFLLIVVILGNVIPLVLTWRARQGRQFNVVTMATLVLLGGFLLRLVIIFSAQSRLS
jgi:formate-dependent nitrite reductase membrane component NrfD